jgi:hypothetical protein
MDIDDDDDDDIITLACIAVCLDDTPATTRDPINLVSNSSKYQSSGNVAIGYQSSGNVAIGYQSSGNVAIGYQSSGNLWMNGNQVTNPN